MKSTKLYLVIEAASGWCVGAFTTIEKASAARERSTRLGYPCKEIQEVTINRDMNLEDTEDESQEQG